MKMRLRIAIRNVFRNKGRSLVSLLMIAGAVSGIILFRGFAGDMLSKLRRATTESEFGHIQFATKAYWQSLSGKARFLENYQTLREHLEKEADVASISGRLSAFGLISNGETTVSGKMMGIEPQREESLLNYISIERGDKFSADAAFEVLIGTGLANQLSIKPGDNATVLAYTVDNVINAIDFTVRGIFKTGVADFDNNVFFVPLSAAQTLLDTKGIDKLTLRVRDIDEVTSIRDRLQSDISKIDSSASGKTWYEQSDFYRRVETFYRVQNRIVIIILISLILLGILNTIGMSVYERTGEIGTVRALGDAQVHIVYQFMLEGTILGILGVMVGFVVGSILASIITALHIGIEIPGATGKLPIAIGLEPIAFFEAAVVCISASTFAAILPAIRGVRIPIVEALKRNI